MINNIETTAGATQDFARLTELQQLHSKAHNQLQSLEVKINELSLRVACDFATEYVVIQEELELFSSQIKALFEAHPEWREGKTVKTPFGEVAQRTVTELEVPNPAMTVALIKAEALHDLKFKAADFLRVEEEPNIEALESLGDDALIKLGICRVKREQVTVKPAKASVSKAVKAAKVKVS